MMVVQYTKVVSSKFTIEEHAQLEIRAKALYNAGLLKRPSIFSYLRHVVRVDFQNSTRVDHISASIQVDSSNSTTSGPQPTSVISYTGINAQNDTAGVGV